MREFKFIRGLHKDENIFSTAEKSSCLFAYDKDGKIVSFDAKNDETFQKRFADLSNEQRLSEIYTLKPNQFTVDATGVPGGSYSFNFTANINVEDGSTNFPEKVKESAEINLKENTTATYNTTNSKPKLNLTGKAAEKTGVTFAFGGKTFTRNLTFNVTGKLKQRGYEKAEGSATEAYPNENNKIDYSDDAKKSGVFHNGRLQKLVTPTTKTVVKNTKNVTSSGELDVAAKYMPGSNFAFLRDGDSALIVSQNAISYEEGLSFTLYQKTEYLIESTQTEAVNSYEIDGKTIFNLKQGYAAHPMSSTISSITVYNSNLEEILNAYEYNRRMCKNGGDEITNPDTYNYYKVIDANAYKSLGPCTVKPLNGEIVKGYIDSYSNCYLIKNGKLVQLVESDLTGENINVYTSNEYNVIGNNVYIDDTTDTKNYVMLNGEWSDDIEITSANATVNNDTGTVSPIITDETFRMITDNTVKVDATQSD